MNKKSIFKLGSGVAVAAIASLAMSGTVYGDQLASDRAELGITAINSTLEHNSGGKPADFDYSQYDKVNLGPLSATIWAPKRGAQGPMRDEATSQQQMQLREIQSRLGPIGGMSTP